MTKENRRRCILIVEDSPTQAESLRLLLEAEGYQVRHAANGLRALDHFATEPPDLVVSDIMMPEMDGFELCRRIKASPETRKIPVVLFTERNGPMDIIQGLMRGADNFILKSSPDAYVLQRVRRIVDQLEHRDQGEPTVEILVRIDDQEIPISANKQQIFELLISSVEEAGRVQEELREAQRQLQERASDLERRVQERTRELSAAEEKYRRLVENAPDMILRYRFVPPRGVEYVNPAAVAMMGYTIEEQYADPELSMKMVHPEDRHLIEAAFRGELPGEPLLCRFVRKDGRVLWTEARFARVCDASGTPVAFEGVLRDVTARRQAELELRKVTEALEQASAAIVITDREGNIEYVNRAFTSFTGYTAEEVLGKNPRILKSGETPAETYRELWQTIQAGETWQGELCNRRKNGELIWEKAVISPVLDAHGKISHFIASKLDVTHSRELEQRLVQGQKMEAIGRLAGGVAHDFNNLLGVITGYAELLARQIGEQHAGRPRLEQILKAAQRAAALTRQLLAFSRKQVLQPTVLDLNAVVAGVEDLLRRLIGEDVRLVTRLEPEPVRVKADPGQIEQVIVNLAVNARDAMPEGGTLVLETASADLDAGYARSHPDAREGRYAVLAVSDTGIGMDAETCSRIFEPFFTTKEMGKGTGLGLSTVYGIVKQSSGHIGVYSEPGRGSTFRVYLPHSGDAEVAEPARAPDVGRALLGTETVLLVEDEEGLRTMILEILEQNGYRVLAADGAEQAHAAARAHAGPVHLLLSDVVMPRTSGRALAESLRPDHPETRVLYMSGYTGEAISHHAVIEPGTPFLQKPFTSEALLRKVREVLANP